MEKHRGFPSRLPGTDYQFTIRRPNKKGVTAIIRRDRFADRKPADRRADAGFVKALVEQFWDQPFVRGNLDAGRISWLFEREVVAVEEDFDPESYDAVLQLNLDLIRANFPDALG